MSKRASSDHPELNPVNVGAAAIDIGSKMRMAAVDPVCTDAPGTRVRHLHLGPA